MRKKFINRVLVSSLVVTSALSNMTTLEVLADAKEKGNGRSVENTQITKTKSSGIKYATKHSIMGSNEVSKEQFKTYLLEQKKKYGFSYKLNCSLDEFLQIAYEEAAKEGVRGDIVVAQAINETGYFKFGGVLTYKDNNFCGLGVTGEPGKKSSFSSVRIGLRAQVQHLKAYGSTAALKNGRVDPRFNMVSRGSAKSLEELAGKWAVPGYERSKYSSLQQAANNNASYGQIVYKHISSAKKYKGTSLNTSSTTKPPTNQPAKPGSVKWQGEVVNISTSLNIRKGPGTNHAIIGSLKKGQKVNVYEESGAWCKISFQSKGKTTYGYISKNYLKKVNTSSTKPTNPSKPTQPTNPSVTKEGTIKVNSKLNVRKGPGTNYATVGSLSNGNKVKINGEKNGWYSISYGKLNGYVKKDYVTVKSTSNNQTNPVNKKKSGTIIKISTILNMRSGAGTNYKVIGGLKNGSKVTINYEKNGWYNISYGNKTGFVKKDYVKVA